MNRKRSSSHTLIHASFPNYYGKIIKNKYNRLRRNKNKERQKPAASLFSPGLSSKPSKKYALQVFWLTSGMSAFPTRVSGIKELPNPFWSLQQRDCPGFAPDSLLILFRRSRNRNNAWDKYKDIFPYISHLLTEKGNNRIKIIKRPSVFATDTD